MDIKHTNPEKHKAFTGRSNERMLENARKTALSGMTRLVIRVPVIPGFNDTVEEIQGIARFAATLPKTASVSEDSWESRNWCVPTGTLRSITSTEDTLSAISSQNPSKKAIGSI